MKNKRVSCGWISACVLDGYTSITSSVLLFMICSFNPTFGQESPPPGPPPTRLLCENQVNPLGIDSRQPRLTWLVPGTERGSKQTAYQILVSDNPETLAIDNGRVWDSGQVKGDQSVDVVYQGQPLASRTVYYWKVRTWDKDGNPSTWPEIASWETGIFDPEEWKAQWIKATGEKSQTEDKKPGAPVMLRKSFNLSKEVKKARAYVSGLGCYEMTLNGQRVGANILAPEWTDYNKRIQYQTYDIAPLLKQGENALGMMLGNAWWGEVLMGLSTPLYKTDAFHALCQIEVDYKDGSHEIVVSDTTWKKHPSPILSDSLYHGESYDARLELPGWNQPGFKDEGWATVEATESLRAQMVSQQCEPIQVTQELKPISVKEPSPGVFVFDMGQNMAGWARLKVSGTAGTTVQLRFAEVLKEDGNIYTENYRSARVTDRYILKGAGEEVWEPRFTYRGFRYVEVTGFPGTPTVDAITGVVFHSHVRRIGQFECSNDLINQIHKNITWSIRGNIHGIPTDCPQRDERLGWSGDAQAIAPTASRIFDMARFYNKWITDLVDTQNPEMGWVSDVAPSIGQGPASPGWGDALVIVPWVVYQEFGDKRIIEDHYGAMAKWISFMEKKSVKGLYKPEHIYGDWIAPVTSPKELIASAYFYYSTSLMSRMAKTLGKLNDHNRYKALAMKTANVFNQTYFNLGKAEYEGETQTTKVLPLHFGIAMEDLAPMVALNLVNDIRERDFHLSTGLIGSAYLMPTLSRWSDDQEVLWRLAVQDTYPSWGYMVRKGATTIWELWNSDTEGPGMNSRNHYALGAVGQWYYQTIAGIDSDPDEPGYKLIYFKPTPLGDLQWAKGSIDTRYGAVSSSWRREGDAFLLDIVLPANTHGLVELPVPVGVHPVITENGKTILSGGKPVKTEGLKYINTIGTRAIFKLESGAYSFKVTK